MCSSNRVSRSSCTETTTKNWFPTSSIASQRMETDVRVHGERYHRKEVGYSGVVRRGKLDRSLSALFVVVLNLFFCIYLFFFPSLYTRIVIIHRIISYSSVVSSRELSVRLQKVQVIRIIFWNSSFFLISPTSIQQDGKNSASWTQWNEEEGRSWCIQERTSSLSVAVANALDLFLTFLSTFSSN